MTSFQPTAINRDSDGSIRIQWTDNSETCWTPSQLRKSCPCATCREKQRADDQADEQVDSGKFAGKAAGKTPEKKTWALPVISAAEARPLRIESMRPVGNYAYNIAFSDGHDSGIFTLAMLHSGFDGKLH